MKRRLNEVVIKQLKSTDKNEVDDALAYLYQLSKQKISQFILRNRGNQQDADDVFHDGLIAFYNMVRADKIAVETNIEAYLFSICKHVWLKKLNKKRKETSLEDTYDAVDEDLIAVDTMLEGEQKVLVEKILNNLGEECRKILLLFYYERLRIKEIVSLLEYSNDQVLRNKKSKCMKTLRRIVMESDFYKNQLIDK